MNSSIGFRCCQRTDLAVCASIATEAFPLKISRSTGEEASEFMQFQIDGCHAISNYRELAVAGGEIAGLLFGRLNRESFVIGSQTLKQLFLISVRSLLGTYGSRRKLIRIIKPGLPALRAVRRNIPASWAEVVLFAVATEHQGVGIGCTLMDRFVHHALKWKVKAISLATDETASFRFYEKYGFRRRAAYKDPLESYFANRPIKAFIYQRLLHKAEG